jgi:hypothetical protein
MREDLLELCRLAPQSFRVNDHGEIWGLAGTHESMIYGNVTFHPGKIRDSLEFLGLQRGWIVTKTMNPHVDKCGLVAINDNAGSINQVESDSPLQAFLSCVLMTLQGEE